jgi:hypothetical protein
MSRLPFREDNSKRTGVVTTGVKQDEYDNPYLENRLPSGYPQRSNNNKPLESIYSNPYGNDYKDKFDNRYPSIWRRPTVKTYVRGLDEWEKSALSAALGIPWNPTPDGSEGGPPDGSEGGPPDGSDGGPPDISEGGPSVTGQPEPSPEPSSAQDEMIIYGPINVGIEPLQSGGAFNNGDHSNTDGQIYVAVTENNREYFVTDATDNNSLHILTKNGDYLELTDELAGGTTHVFRIGTTIPEINQQIDIIRNVPQLTSNNAIAEQIRDMLGVGQGVGQGNQNIYDTGYKLTNSSREIYTIYLRESPLPRVFYISHNNTNEYQIGPYNNSNQAYFTINGNVEVFDIINPNGERVTYTALSDIITSFGNLIQPDEPVNIIPLDDTTTTGGKYKKNKNKSRRFRKHFRKTRKSHKE